MTQYKLIRFSSRSQSVAATPDREIKRKWSISASTDYLNKTNKDNYMCRNNPIGKNQTNLMNKVWIKIFLKVWQNLL